MIFFIKQGNKGLNFWVQIKALDWIKRSNLYPYLSLKIMPIESGMPIFMVNIKILCP